ncbi:uncharacterized protein LOC143062530 [Mytilus galloprovincialis]|uniref:uncharacterized protein LOC143062530 n=1 Tax=Mytilus galloprovincialis TaxID=29158 RepID=UPI003F7C04D0
MEENRLPGVIGLNIGGYKFTTRLSTLIRYSDSMLGAMFSGRHNLDKDNKDNYFIDRNGKYFQYVLEFLRDENFFPPIDVRKNVLIEAEYFGIKPLVDKLKRLPPLFPDEVIVDNLRNKMKDYRDIKEKISQLSTVHVVDQSGISFQPTSHVYVIWYKIENPVQGTYKTKLTFEDIVTIWVRSPENVSKTVCIPCDEQSNSRDLFRILQHDLKNDGYILTLKSTYSNQPDDYLRYEFNGDVFIALACTTLEFTWKSDYPKVVGLNIGGKKFTTRLSTLTKYPDSMLGAMFSGRHKLDADRNGDYFIDRNGKYFHYILEFLRDENVMPPSGTRERVLKEADYFGIKPLAEKLRRYPPLFPDGVILDNLRNKVTDYLIIKAKIAELSTMDVIENSEIYCQKASFVYVTWYTTENLVNGREYQTRSTFEDVVSSWVGSKLNVDKTLCVYSDGYPPDIAEFYRVLLYDLTSDGFVLSMKNHYRSIPNSYIWYEYNNQAYAAVQWMTLEFTWESSV